MKSVTSLPHPELAHADPVKVHRALTRLLSRCGLACCMATTLLLPNGAEAAMQLIANCYPTSGCYEESCTAVATGGTGAKTYFWDFGDSSAVVATASNVISHTFPPPACCEMDGTTPTDNPIPYTVAVYAVDANNSRSTIKYVTGVVPGPYNLNPVANVEVVDLDDMTITLRDLSFDPDFNRCNHDGSGLIHILWGDGSNTLEPITLSGAESNQLFDHTYSVAGQYTISHIVRDNNGGMGYGPTPLAQIIGDFIGVLKYSDSSVTAYATMQEAYATVEDGDIIQLKSGQLNLTTDLLFDNPSLAGTTIYLYGGYTDLGDADHGGFTIIAGGQLVVQSGTVELENIIIM